MAASDLEQFCGTSEYQAMMVVCLTLPVPDAPVVLSLSADCLRLFSFAPGGGKKRGPGEEAFSYHVTAACQITVSTTSVHTSYSSSEY